MEVASITIAQALLLGFFWWFKTNYYGQTFTCFISNSCLTAALFVGIVLGDIPNAMIIGASVQLIYLGILGPGGNLPQDPVLATLVSTAIVLKSGMPVETAFAIAVPVGILGAQILSLIRLINTTWVHMADKYAEKGNTRGIYLAGLLYPSLARIPITVTPVAVAVYFGAAHIDKILAVADERTNGCRRHASCFGICNCHKDYWKEGIVTIFCCWIFYFKAVWNRNFTAFNFWCNRSLFTYYVYE